MGYRRPQTTYRLVFEGDEFAGLEVLCNAASIGDYLALAELASIDFNDPQIAVSHLDEVNRLLKTFADVLVEWNLEDDHGPVDATYEALCAQDLGFVKAIIMAWLNAVVSVANPLDETSSDGEQFPEDSLPMEVS